jgi:RNA polymerase sigma-70 factor (ECF subfamily)
LENESKLVEHLFRHEAGKITSVMAKIFGFSRLEEAEDIVQDTFIAAYETWKLKGIPENPTAWLYKVARNKFLNHVKRQNNYQRIISENKSVFPLEYTITAKIEEELQHIDDNQIQMLFALCHPSIPEDSQVALALKTLSLLETL